MIGKKFSKYYKLITISILCWLVVSFTYAIDNFSFRNITVEHGLTSNTINCIFKDSHNFIWLGTANGLNRFDGFNIISFDPFKNKSIVAISEPDSIHLYIASEKELFLFNRRERKSLPLQFRHDKPIHIKSIHLDSDKNLYIITNEGLFKLTKNTNEAVKISNPQIKDKYLTDIYIDNQNICWLTSSEGLIKFDLTTQNVDIKTAEGFDEKYVCLAKHDKDMYIGTQSNQILYFDTQLNKFSLLATLKNEYVQNLYYFQNKLYIGTNGGGLKIINLNDGSIKILKHDTTNPESLSTNAIYSVFMDESALWIGTFSGGLNYTSTRRNTFKVHTIPNVLSTFGQNIRSFKLDGKGHEIFGTRNGLIYATEKNIKTFNVENTPDLKSNIILCIQPYNDNYFIGTYSGGVNVLDTKSMTIKPFRSEPIFTENSFYSILQDKNDLIWFGTLSGLIKYDIKKETYTIFNKENSGLITNDIHYIMQDKQGRIWIATREGVCYFENGKIQRPEKINLSFVTVVRYLYEDSEHNIWLGCENEGVVKINRDLDSYQHFTSNDFLPDNYVSSIIEGVRGVMWMTTGKGIVCYNTNTSAYSIFSLKDGIPSYAFNDGSVQKTNDANIWWGNEKGLILLNTPNISDTEQNTSFINITGVLIDGVIEDANIKNLPAAPEYLNTITLPSSQNSSIVLRFSDFDYDYPQSNIYEYKLEGYNHSWQKEIGKNEILIPNPPAGKYKLLIRKAGSEEPIKTIIIIKPKSYTVYIWILLFIVIIASFLLIYKRLLSKFIKQKNAIKKESETVSKIKYQNIKIEKDELEIIKKALTQYMEQERPYLNPDLKLDDIATAIQCPKAKVSQVLNQYLDTNFANYITKYRIEMFKEKAAEGLIHQYTLSALARECGFSSRSSFFHSLKKLTGQTPLEFLKDAGIDIDKI